MFRQPLYDLFAEEDSTDSLLNLTPLIDVVFVVLMMFIILAPIIHMEKVELASGTANAQTARANQSEIYLTVEKDNSIMLNGKRIDRQHLVSQLHLLKEKNKKAVPKLYQDASSQFGTFQLVKNALTDAGFSEVEIILR